MNSFDRFMIWLTESNILLIFGILFLSVILHNVLFGGLMVDEEVVIKCAETNGLSDISIQDKAWFLIGLRSGGHGDNVRFEMKTTNPTGDQVTIYVFSGWPFKGATIRIL